VEARGTPGAVTLVHAELEKLPAPPAPPPAPEPVALPVAPRLPDVVTEVRFPSPPVTVLAARHTKSLEKSNAARVELDPDTTYKVSMEGRVSFGGKVADVWVDDCFYALEGPGVRQEAAFGVLTSQKPLTVTGATRLYAFVTDTGVARHSGAFRLTVQARGEPPKMTLVDAISHNVMPEKHEMLRVINLRVLDVYKITVRDGAVPARTRPAGQKTRVLFSQQAGVITPLTSAEELKPHRVLEAGKSYSVASANNIWFWFPDDDPSDNQGSVEVTIEVDLEPGATTTLGSPKKRTGAR
jgi:hypothetical protein